MRRSTWLIAAGRKDLTYEPRVDEQLVATTARPVQ